jgi:hypothetical protein
MLLLGSRNGRSYYRVIKTGRTCYGVGPAGAPRGPSEIVCWASQPPALIDFSAVSLTAANPQRHLLRLEGLARDGITDVAVIGIGQRMLVKVPVERGIYYLASPPSAPATAIVAHDAAGRVVATRSE